MAFRLGRVGNLVLVRWERVEEPDVTAFVDGLRAAQGELGDRRPFVAGIVPEHAEAPPHRVRQLMAERTVEALHHTERAFAVLEGSSVRSMLHRLVVTAAFAFAGHRDRLTVCRSLDDVIGQLGRELHATRSDVHATAARLFRSEGG